MIMYKHLDDLGRLVIAQSRRNSKIAKAKKGFTGGSLRDSGDWKVEPFNVLNLAQNSYGKYNTPKGQATPSDRTNITNTPLLNSIDKNVPDGVDVLIRDLVDLLKSPLK